MPNISIQPATALSFLGLTAVIIGLLLILGGTGIISPAMIQIVPARKTWIAGVVLTFLGALFILPEVLTPRTAPPSAPTTSPTEEAGRPTATSSVQQEPTRLAQTSQPTVVPTTLSPTQTLPAQSLPTPLSTQSPVAPALSRCDWLAANFPQTPESIATQFGLPIERIQMVREGCGETANGFVVLLGSPVELTVDTTKGGCIDAPQDAAFSDATVPDTAGGLRAFSGTVRAVVMTYRPWC